ncbi:hypothetical protein CLOM_g18594 [Closterium sp. NIES-68]|nr:hypothetical protein CLOM_g18594 [Closterium sp. NIES-68]
MERPARERSADLESTGDSESPQGRASSPAPSNRDWERGLLVPSTARQQTPERMRGQSRGRTAAPQRHEEKSPERALEFEREPAARGEEHQSPRQQHPSRRGTPQRRPQAVPGQQRRTPQAPRGRSGQRVGWRAGGGSNRGSAAERRLGRAAATREGLFRSVAPPQQALAYSPRLLTSQQYQPAHPQPMRLPLPQAPAPAFPPRSVAALPLLDRPYLLAPLPSAPLPPVLPSADPFDPRRLDVRSAETLPPWQPTPPDVSVVGWSHGPPPSVAPASFGGRATAPFVPPRRSLASPTGVEGGAEAAEMGGADEPVQDASRSTPSLRDGCGGSGGRVHASAACARLGNRVGPTPARRRPPTRAATKGWRKERTGN